jgi:chaperone BCS1
LVTSTNADTCIQTNYYDRLDPALVRPGRIDVKVEYMKATADQAASLFQRFFPPERFSSTSSSSSVAAIHSPATTPANKRIRQTPLSRSLDELCSSFASAVPEHEFTAAELQGYLLTCKWDPETAVAGLGAWVEDERRQRTERLEREEREKGKMRGKMTRENKSKGEEGVARSEEGKTAKVVKAERT